MKVIWTEPARTDLVVLLDHLAADNPRAARKVRDRIVEAASGLREFPLKGRPGRAALTRELVLPGLPWLLVYRVVKSGIEILAVVHGAWEWPIS